MKNVFLFIFFLTITLFSTLTMAEPSASSSVPEVTPIRVTEITMDKSDTQSETLYVATDNAVFIKEKDAQPIKILSLAEWSQTDPHRITHIAVDASKTVYVGTYNGLLIGKKDPSSGQYHFICTYPPGNKHGVFALYVKEKNVYIGATFGLYRLGPMTAKGEYLFYQILSQDARIPWINAEGNTDEIGGNTNEIRSLFVDKNETIYAGIDGDGLLIGTKCSQRKWSSYCFTHIGKEINGIISAVYVDNAGVIYAIAEDEIFIKKTNDPLFTKINDCSTGSKPSLYVSDRTGKIYFNSFWDVIIGKKNHTDGMYYFSDHYDYRDIERHIVMGSQDPDGLHVLNAIYVNETANVIYLGTNNGVSSLKMDSLDNDRTAFFGHNGDMILGKRYIS